MTPSHYQSQINRLEAEIAALYKKVADEHKKENDKNKQIATINNSINRSTSISSLQNKQRQISNYQNDILSIKHKIADLQKQIATKSASLGTSKAALRKAEEDEIKKNQKKQTEFQKKLISDLKRQQDELRMSSTDYFEEPIDVDIAPEKQFDFFISHASEDKDDLVRDLALALKANGFEVWYDEFELKIGDSLRRTIDKGLVNSRYGLVIISPSFIKKNWPEYELNGMVAREMNGQKVILPIWHKISKDEVLKFSPSLADKMALNTSNYTVDDIALYLRELF